MIEIEDGEFARGKRVQVTYDGLRDNAPKTVLRVFEVMSKIQRPGEKITAECKSVFTESGKATSCEVSLTKDSDDARPL